MSAQLGVGQHGCRAACGGPIGAAVDGVSCKTIAGYAMRTFPPVVPRVVRAEAVATEVATGEVVEGEIVPDEDTARR